MLAVAEQVGCRCGGRPAWKPSDDLQRGFNIKISGADSRANRGGLADAGTGSMVDKELGGHRVFIVNENVI
jgi:hypothetical protein